MDKIIPTLEMGLRKAPCVNNANAYPREERGERAEFDMSELRMSTVRDRLRQDGPRSRRATKIHGSLRFVSSAELGFLGFQFIFSCKTDKTHAGMF